MFKILCFGTSTRLKTFALLISFVMITLCLPIVNKSDVPIMVWVLESGLIRILI